MDKWITINNVWIRDSSSKEQYGYVIRNNPKDHRGKIVSMDTAKQMVEKDILEISNWSYLSACSVPRDFIDDAKEVL
ncbi:hypothetical protein [Paenibacillus sp. FSL H3-0333]|uniref:hypothetical protein n=1 Tax=Paenibacillus sp. FSL H3-0333 TaxID=2921373 RepID=UPI0030F956C5